MLNRLMRFSPWIGTVVMLSAGCVTPGGGVGGGAGGGAGAGSGADQGNVAITAGAGPGAFTSLTATEHLTTQQRDSNVTVNTTAVGSGVNGPATTQTGMTVNVTKDNWFNGPAAVGELDGVYITTRQGGAGSDSSGLLVDVQNTGQGFLSATEMVSNIVDPVHNVLTYGIDLQDGVLNQKTGDFIGRVFSADFGKLQTAMLVQNSPGASWGNVLVNLKDGTTNLTIDDDGNIGAARIAANGSVVLGGDIGNGSVDIGVANSAATPYISFHGNQVSASARIINDAVGQVTIQGQDGGANANLKVSGTAQLGAYAFASLPRAGSAGRMLFCADCLKPGEARGAGTGMLVFDDGRGWFSTAGAAANH